jgi:hypothetical protein
VKEQSESDSHDDAQGKDVQIETKDETPLKSDSNGPVVRKFSPEDLSVCVQEYDGFIETVRLMTCVSHSGVKNAATQCTVYQGYRWQLIPRSNVDDHIPLQPTVECQTRRTGFIAEMNHDGVMILNRHTNQKTAAVRAKVSPASVSTALKYGRLTGAERIMFRYWDEINEDIQNAWLLKHPKHVSETVPKSNSSKPIYRTHVISKKVERYESMTELRTKTNVTTKTVKSRMKKGIDYKGWIYSFTKPSC